MGPCCGVLHDAENHAAVGARHQFLAAAALPHRRERWRRHPHRCTQRIRADRQRYGERKQTGGIETGMGDEEGVSARRHAVECEATVSVGFDVARGATQPNVRATQRRMPQAIVYRPGQWTRIPLARSDRRHENQQAWEPEQATHSTIL